MGHSAPRLSPELLGSDTNFAAAHGAAPCGRAEGSANLGSDPKNSLRRVPHRPDSSHGFVIAGRWFVIAGLTRNPVVVWHWIPDVETPDLIRGRDDKPDVRDDKLGVRDDKLRVRDDKAEGRGTFAE